MRPVGMGFHRPMRHATYQKPCRGGVSPPDEACPNNCKFYYILVFSIKRQVGNRFSLNHLYNSKSTPLGYNIQQQNVPYMKVCDTSGLSICLY